MAWVVAAKVSEIPKGKGRSIDMGSVRVGIFHVGGKFYALRDACIHRGGPLGEGQLSGDLVMCPWHAWEFNVKTGQCVSMKGAKQDSFPLKIERGDILIDLP